MKIISYNSINKVKRGMQSKDGHTLIAIHLKVMSIILIYTLINFYSLTGTPFSVASL